MPVPHLPHERLPHDRPHRQRVLRTIIDLNPAEHVPRPMRELMYNWGDIGTGLLVIAGLGLLVLPLTARNDRSVYS